MNTYYDDDQKACKLDSETITTPKNQTITVPYTPTNWKVVQIVELSDESIDKIVKKVQEAPLQVFKNESQIAWKKYPEDMPRYEDEYWVTILDETGDTKYWHVAIGTFYTNVCAWYVENDILTSGSSIRVIAWARMEKPEPYKENKKE